MSSIGLREMRDIFLLLHVLSITIAAAQNTMATSNIM